MKIRESVNCLDIPGAEEPQEYDPSNLLHILDLSTNEWLGEEYLIHNEGLYMQTAISKGISKALKISVNDLKKRIPREYIRELRELAQMKQDYIKDRAKMVYLDNLSHKKMDNKLSDATDSALILHPHIPLKLARKVAFGDGKIRNRH